MVLSALAPSLAGGLPQRLRFVGPQCVCAGHRLHGNIFRTTARTIVPIWQCSAAYSAIALSSLEDNGLGEERSGCCSHTRREGITLPTPGGMTRLDPVRLREVRSWSAGRMSRWAR